jgi:phospholipid/cholesterol/gamma-HCH transport system substrate-binding protein
MRGFVPQLVKFAIFAVITVLLTTVLATTVANVDNSDKAEYSARFTDVTGLVEGDDVRMAGVKVGTVESIEVVDDREALVSFEVDSARHISKSASAAVKYRNLIGRRYVSLDMGPGDPNDVLKPSETIPVQRTQPPLNLTALFNGFKPLFQALRPDEVNKLSYEIIQVLQGEGGTVESLLRHTGSLTQTVARKDQVIGQVVNNLNSVLGTVNERSPELSGLLDQTQQLVTGLSQQREPIGHAIDSLGDLSDTTAGLVEEGREPLKRDINHLGDLAQNLNAQAPLLNQTLENMPHKMETVGRTASYSSWYNYYACQMHGNIGIKSLGIQVPIFPLPAQELPDRCKP